VIPEASLVRLGADGDDVEAVWQEMLDRNWSDGLPVLPPTAKRVERMLGGRDPNAVHVTLGVEGAEAKMAKIAANAVMAGCTPAYFSAVLAALSGVSAIDHGRMFLNSPAAPLLVFNGPIRSELGINCGEEMLSMVSRANATIGRAVRLSMMNIGGAVLGRLFDVQHGMPGRASMVFGEFEEESPWESYAVSAGGDAGRSSVSVFAAFGTMPINYHQVPQRPDEMILILTKCLDYVRGNRIGPWPDTAAVMVLSPKHARGFAVGGWTKQRLEDELTRAVNDHYTYDLVSNREKIELINRGRDSSEPQLQIPMPEDPVRVLVAGGVAGWHSLMIPTRAGLAPQTVSID
jgi:hypothetical protein